MRGLAFSGGRDSWACLWLNKDSLDSIHVIWVNTGKNIPEVLETVNMARGMCANFHEVKTNKEAQNAVNGYPADVVPINWTVMGQQISGKKDVTIQSYLGCCYENISAPLHLYAKKIGITELIKGQRITDTHKGYSLDGSVFDGITYRHPIEGWSKSDVTDYLSTKMPLPRHFSLNHSSVDCFDCTAFVKENQDKSVYMETHYPDLFAEFSAKKTLVDSAIEQALRS